MTLWPMTRFKAVAEAFHILSSRYRRAQYDALGRRDGAAATGGAPRAAASDGPDSDDEDGPGPPGRLSVLSIFLSKSV